MRDNGRVLVVIGHPDDETIGCGGTLARLSREGHAIRVLLPIERIDPRGKANWKQLIQSFRQACAILGAEPRVPERLIDEAAAITHPHALHDFIVDDVAWANTVLTHWSGDTHQVHRALAQAVEVATRPFRRRRDVWLFETATSTEQGYAPSFAPNMHVLLSERDAETKIKAMQLYPVEHFDGRTPADLMLRMKLRGREIGADFAEAFVAARRFIE